jgi:hypothetical protein
MNAVEEIDAPPAEPEGEMSEYAARAEGEQPGDDEPSTDDDPNEEGDETDDDTETDTAAEPTAAAREAWSPTTEKEIEKAQNALQREAERHDKRVAEIMGADAEGLVRCEACALNLPGYHWPAEMFEPGSGERILYDLLAGEQAQPLQPGFLETCSACNGVGRWKTGSFASEEMKWLTCSVCGGKGYQDTRGQTPSQTTTPVLVAVPEPDVPAFPDPPEVDFMNRPKGHMNFGKLPQYMTQYEKDIDGRDGFSV